MVTSEGQTRAALDLRAFIDSVLTIAWSALPDGSLDFINQRFRDYTGLSSDQLIGWEWKSVVHPDDIPQLQIWWQDVRQSEKAGTTEKRLRRFDGAYRWFRIAAAPVYDEQANLIRWCGINTDIDDLKRSEQKFRQEAADLRTITDAIRQCIVVIAPDGAILYANDVIRDVTGFTIRDVMDKGFLRRVFHPDDQDRVLSERQEGLLRGIPFELESRVLVKTGQYRWWLVQYNPLKDQEGRIIRWYGTATDIDDLKQTEEGLRASERSLRQIVDCVPGFVCTATATGEVEFFNQQSLNYFGKTLEDLKSWTTMDVIHPADLPQVITDFRNAIETGQPWDIVHRLRRADGVYRWFQSHGVPQRDVEGRIIRWFSLLADIDDRKRAEQELKRSEEFLAEGQRLSRTGSFSWCVETNEITWSEQLYCIFEFDKQLPVTLERIGTRVYPDDLPLLQDMIERTRQAASDFEYQHRLLMPDRSVKHIHLFARATRDKYGRLEYVGAAQDVTDLHTITDAIANPVVVLTPDGTTLYANRVALDQLGATLGKALSEGLFPRACHPDDIDRARNERRVGLAQEIPFELEMRLLKNGAYRWHLLQYNPLRDERGQIIRWYGTATDIDDRKRTEERLRNENLVLREEIDRSSMFEEIVGSCKPMREVLKQVERVAPSDSTVLILGETGTGKELIARALHRRSKRATRAFVRVNCAAIPQSLIASELFGHEKGAFTGALQRRVGRFEAADGGTLFLDEIGDLPMEMQITLLRVLQEKEFERLGGNHPISVDVRVIAATNRDLPAAVAAGTFRQDLFYRLNVVPIAVPPLRERAEDIPLLVEYFVGRYANAAGKSIRHIGKDTLEQLKGYRWPGNIRELQNVVERAVILSETDTFAVDDSWLKRESADSSPQEGLSSLADREVEMIQTALAESHGRISGPSGAAAKLGIPRQTLESKIQRLGIDKYGQKRPTSK